MDECGVGRLPDDRVGVADQVHRGPDGGQVAAVRHRPERRAHDVGLRVGEQVRGVAQVGLPVEKATCRAVGPNERFAIANSDRYCRRVDGS